MYFLGMGVSHHDGMSCIIPQSFWRHPNGIDIRLEGQIERHEEYWQRFGKM
jgi:hypothetical protein